MKKIENLQIKNFKSIKTLDLDCRRINLFIGEPNVGKSNILEAISFFSVPFHKNEDKFLGDFIRYENLSNLFYNQDLNKPIQIDCSSCLDNSSYYYW